MVTESDPVTGRTDITFADGSQQTTERLEDGSLATTMANGETLVTAPDGSQTFVGEDGAVTETTVNEDGSKVIAGSDGTKVQQAVSEDGVLTATYASEAPADAGEGEEGEAAPVPQGVQQDPATGETTVILSSGEAVGHSLGTDGVLTLKSSATDPPTDDAAGGGVGTEEAPVEAETRLAVINPAVGEVITEGDVTLVESTFTDTGGVAMAVASTDGEADTEPTEVSISADGTQQAITTSTGESATATTSDTGVVIAMDPSSMQASLDNLDPGDQQSLVASDGAAVTATTGADGEVTYIDGDGQPAIKEDGSSYTADDMAAMVVDFDEE